nr:MAG TPA: hypothetical protein [Caudoviricetes sp.]
MDEKIKIAITKQDNESEKAENTGKKRVKRKKNKNWDDMAQSMQDFIISLKQNSDLFLPEDSYKKLEMYKKTYDRLLYTVLSDEIFSCFDDETKIKEGTNILTNIDALLVYCENNENYEKNVHNIILKLKDHANLASRQYNSLKQTDEEYQQKFNKRIFGFKEKVTQEMAAQLITLVGIFTAIAFVVFGGLSSLESIFSNKRPLIEIIVIASIWMLGMINLVFIFLKGISNMTQLDISSKNSDNLLEKYIWIIWFNLIFILVIISIFWINFAKNSIILNNLFTKWKEWIYVGGTFLLIILIISTIWFLINNTKSIKLNKEKHLK